MPIILLDSDGGNEAFRRSFPLVITYIDRHYTVAATHTFDGRFGINLLVRRDTAPKSTWEPLGWPCFGSGRVSS